MKNIILYFFFACLITSCASETTNEHQEKTIHTSNIESASSILEDGVYLLKASSSTSTSLNSNESEIIIETDAAFEHNQSDSIKYYLIDTKAYVPLKTNAAPSISANSDPKIEGDTVRLSQLHIVLAPEYSDLLEKFTTENVDNLITIVIGGKAITKHIIREPIIGGNIQISRCTDNACEVLLLEMEKNIIQ